MKNIIIGGKQMKNVSKQMSMEISGGHNVVAYPRPISDDPTEKAASEPGVAGWEKTCPKKKHTLVHIYDGLVYEPKYGGNGRRYVCPRKNCV